MPRVRPIRHGTRASLRVPAHRRHRHRVRILRSRWSILPLALALAACTANSEEVRPRAQDIFFPTGATISPDQAYLFITNANSELRYDSGSVGVVDLQEVDRIAGDWVANQTVPAGCQIDVEHRETLNCDDGGAPAPNFVLADAGIRIGNFASAVAVQQLMSGALRLIIAVRGDPSITWADFVGGRLTCSSEVLFPLCDEEHRLNHLRDIEDLTIPDEPFQVFVDSRSGFAAVTHLTSGSVTLVDTPPAPTPDNPTGIPKLTDIIGGLFDADQNGARGAAGVAGRSPNGTGADIVYVTSRTEDRVQMLTVQPGGPYGAIFVPGNFFFLDGVGANNGGSSDTRYAQFDATGDRLFLVNRQPPSLQVYDTSLDQTGFPRNEFLAATDLCREASNMAVADVGDGTKAFVTCFRDGEVYVIDPDPNPEVEAIVTVGRGPFGVAVSEARHKLYVTNFLDDTIAVVELDPESGLRYQVILRIGVPR
jgi:YVTN family beta-propeller protein